MSLKAKLLLISLGILFPFAYILAGIVDFVWYTALVTSILYGVLNVTVANWYEQKILYRDMLEELMNYYEVTYK